MDTKMKEKNIAALFIIESERCDLYLIRSSLQVLMSGHVMRQRKTERLRYELVYCILYLFVAPSNYVEYLKDLTSNKCNNNIQTGFKYNPINCFLDVFLSSSGFRCLNDKKRNNE